MKTSLTIRVWEYWLMIAPYRTSVQLSLWRREVFLELIRAGETVWQFEVNGSVRSRKYGPTFLSIKQVDGDDYFHGIRYVCTAINYGKWSSMAKDYARNEGVTVDLSAFPSETWFDEFWRRHPVGKFSRRWASRAGLALLKPGTFATKAVARVRYMLGERGHEG